MDEIHVSLYRDVGMAHGNPLADRGCVGPKTRPSVGVNPVRPTQGSMGTSATSVRHAAAVTLNCAEGSL